MASSGSRTLRAAGTVVVRSTPRGPELLLVHRDRYDDWSLPKGKLRSGEPAVLAARRETLEETGHRVRLGPPAGMATYKVGGRPKEVRFWRATALGEPQARRGREVDETAWFGLDAALEALQHKSEREIALEATRQPASLPLVIARHAKARPRKKWRAADADRPLQKRGDLEAVRLGELLTAWSPARVLTSPSRRCVDTVTPYAGRVSSTVQLEELLGEEQHDRDPAAVAALLRQLAADVRRALGSAAGRRPAGEPDNGEPGDGGPSNGAPGDGEPGDGGPSNGAPGVGAVVCTHRPVLPTIADALAIPVAGVDRNELLRPGGCWVLHLASDDTVAVETHAV